MSVSQWLASLFQPQRPASCHLHLLNENQELDTLQTLNLEKLLEAQPVGEPALELLFKETVYNLGGKENILLVGEAGHSSDNDDWKGGLLEDLSFALFGTPQKCPSWLKNVEAKKTPHSSLNCVSSEFPCMGRALDFPVILAIFRDTLITDSAHSTLLKEVLSDVQLRTRESRSAVIGIVYLHEPCEEQKKMEFKELLSRLMRQIFKKQPWGVCCYVTFQPKTIEEVKWTIIKTLGGKIGGDGLFTKYQNYDLNESFRDLVCQLGGKEHFLLLGNICPSTRASEKAGAFKQLTKALFDDGEESLKTHDGEKCLHLERKMASSKECLQLPKPRSFPYPLILVVFRSAFLKEESNRAQVREILADIKERVNMSSTHVIGVVCSQDHLQRTELEELQDLLGRIMCQIFSCSLGVCSFVTSKPETVDRVKKCICGTLKQKS